MGIMITYHGYNGGYNNPMYNVLKNMGVLYMAKYDVCILQNMMSVLG